METAIAVISAIIAAVSVIFAYFQTRAAKEAIRQASLLGLFGTFDRASEATLHSPELLFEVHGLPHSLGEDEARRIAYLSLLLDGFQHFYGQLYAGDYTKMVEELKQRSVFLNRILRVKGNKTRWDQLKHIYYGDFDSGFLSAIDALFEHELQTQAEQSAGRNALPRVGQP